MSADTANSLISFPPGDFPYLAAAAIVARTGTAWFDVNATGVRLAAMGNELGLVRPLCEIVSNRVSNPPISGFGIAAAELPSVVTKASKERWASLDINVTPQDDTATVVQDRKVLTGGTPPEMNLLEGLLDLSDDKLDRADLTLCWQRPSALDSLSTGDGETGVHIGALRECLDAAETLIPSDADQPPYELLELANGLAHGGSLNLRFCLEAPSLRGVDLRLSRSQVRPLAKLLAAFDPLRRHNVSTSQQHYILTDDNGTELYAVIPTHRHPQRAGEVLSNRPNTEARVQTGLVKAKIKDPLRKGRGAVTRNQVLRAQLTNDQVPRLLMTTHAWSTGKRNAGAGRLQPTRSEMAFDILTELSLVEKVLTVCDKQIVLQSDPEWFYIRSVGQFTQLTAQVRAYPTEEHRLEAQIRNLPRIL